MLLKDTFKRLTNEMYSRVNEKLIYLIDITFGINESIFSGNEQQKVYFPETIFQMPILTEIINTKPNLKFPTHLSQVHFDDVEKFNLVVLRTIRPQNLPKKVRR